MGESKVRGNNRRKEVFFKIDSGRRHSRTVSKGQTPTGIQLRKTGFRVKPGMTIKVKGLLTH
jgi:hypothetical protein